MLPMAPLLSVLAHCPLMAMGASLPPSADSDIPTGKMAGSSLSSGLHGEVVVPHPSAYGGNPVTYTRVSVAQLNRLPGKFKRRASAVYDSCTELEASLRKQMLHALLACAERSYLRLDTKLSSTGHCYVINEDANPGRDCMRTAMHWAAERPGPHHLQSIIACYRMLFGAYNSVLSESRKRWNGAWTGCSDDAAEGICACAGLKEIDLGCFDHCSREHLNKFRTNPGIDGLLKTSDNMVKVLAQDLCEFYNDLVRRSNQKASASPGQCRGGARIVCIALCQVMELCADKFKEAVGYVNISQNCNGIRERATDSLCIKLSEALISCEARGLSSMQVKAAVESVVDEYVEEVKVEFCAL
ncbi:hypothetical protein PAPHI01_1450 [Pancytospora philotis]|nr:hypothetical protein PAPHI01_1450 [Pancytospora philotis]